MSLAKKEGITLQLHVEGELESTYRDLSVMAEKAGLSPRRLVRHYAPATISKDVTQGLTPSVFIGKGAISELMQSVESCSHGFFLETDYMDDVRRPGAVLGPKTVPKRTHQLLEAGLDEEYLWKAHRDLGEELYGQSIR